MVAFDFNINGTDLISGMPFASVTEMKKWVTSTLKQSAPSDGKGSDVVIATMTVVDRVTPKHFIKYKFTSGVSESGKGINVHVEKF